MLGHLIRKEILDHISGFRFVILSVAGALVIWLSVYSGYLYYQSSLQDYNLGQVATEERVRQFEEAYDWLELSGIGYLIHKPPTPLSIFVRGVDPSVGRSFCVGGFVRRVKMSPATTDPIVGVFTALDLGFVVQIVLSLFVLLLTYDAICGEKERGTLRLVTSFPVARHQLLLAKLIGSVIPVLAAFGLPLLLAIAVVLALPDVHFSNAELCRLAMVVAAFGLYLAVFACVGLFSGSVTHRGATSFVVLLAFWVASVAVVPRLAIIVADGIRSAPSVHEYQAQKAALQRKGLDRHRELRRIYQEEHPNIWETAEGRETYWLYYTGSRKTARASYVPDLGRLEEDFRNRYRARLSLAVALARLSPAFAYKNAVTAVAGTGVSRQTRFESAVRAFDEQTGTWRMETKDLDTMKRFHPGKYGEPDWDVSGMPRFAFEEVEPEVDGQAAVVDGGILALWGVLAFAGAYVAVIRYDVR